MCGFAGFHSPGVLPPDAAAIVGKMGSRLSHRGPDDSSDWVGPSVGTALAFRRLSIIDLSELGRQPMVSADGRLVLAMNGEVYNHRVLRADLEQRGKLFRGHSDTEVLLEGISEWGLPETLRRCVGMFALALVDLGQKRLHLARDRLGEKPLYYGWSGGHFFFGSELKAFRPHPGFVPEVDRSALTLFLRFCYVPSPHCILSGFHKLLPGHTLTIPLDGTASPGAASSSAYWTIPSPSDAATFTESPEDCSHRLEELLRDSIRLQMLADVPVGAFLSGGIDSSTVVSLMQAQAARPVRTFTIAFPDALFDESPYAEKVARHLGTEHITWRCEDATLLDLARQLPEVYSEPFADDSQLPTLALARLCRQHVTVSLSGDGGDELFHGYGRYRNSLRRWRQIQGHPELQFAFRHGINVLSALLPMLPESHLKRSWLSRLGKARNQWLSAHLPGYYRHRISRYKMPDLYLRSPSAAPEFFDVAAAQPAAWRDDPSWLSYLDLHTYLPDDILVKVDRAAMAFGLETRIPFLDHRIVEYASRIPSALKEHDGRLKWPLHRILQRNLPAELIERPKRGFDCPIDRWLRGPLRDWAEDLLEPKRMGSDGFFQTEELRRLWQQHQRGQRQRGLMLWSILMFQAWYASF